MSNYVKQLKPTDMVQLTEGMDDVSETVGMVTVFAAINALNTYNIGGYHPDVYVVVKHRGNEVMELIDDSAPPHAVITGIVVKA